MYMIVNKDGCVKTNYYFLRRQDSIHYHHYHHHYHHHHHHHHYHHHPRAKMEASVCSEEGSVCKDC